MQRVEPDSELAVWVWQTLARMYGSSFVAQYGEGVDKIWAAAISKLNRDQVKRGITVLANSGSEFPPSLPRFLEMCKPKSAGVRYLGVPTDPKKMLTHQKASKERAAESIDRMRAMLSGD